jgi:diguanylate cyclase (GGDEF)-like protein
MVRGASLLGIPNPALIVTVFREPNLNAKMRKSLVRRYILLATLSLSVGLATQISLGVAAENRRSTAHTQAILQHTERTLSLLKDAETGQRGYLLVGKDYYLWPYRLALAAVPREIDALVRLTRNEPSQLARIGRLRGLAERKLAELRRTVELQQERGIEAALTVVRSDVGQHLMDEAREIAAAVEKHESALLQTHTDRAIAVQAIACASAWLQALGGLIIMILAYRRVAAELKRRSRLQRRLRAIEMRLRETNAKLNDLATSDALTGLKNRRAFDAGLGPRVARATRHGEPLSLIMLDFDHFKRFNDTFGHPAGDDVLRTVASLLRTEVRDHDLLTRFGGEEFIVALPLTDRVNSLIVAERLRTTIADFPWPHRSITASIGVATLVDKAAGAATLIQEADEALYRSKNEGRNRVSHADSSGGLEDYVDEGSVDWQGSAAAR